MSSVKAEFKIHVVVIKLTVLNATTWWRKVFHNVMMIHFRLTCCRGEWDCKHHYIHKIVWNFSFALKNHYCLHPNSLETFHLYSIVSNKLQLASIFLLPHFVGLLNSRSLSYESSYSRILDACKYRRNSVTAFRTSKRDDANLQATFKHCTAWKEIRVEMEGREKLIKKKLFISVCTCYKEILI